MAELQHSQIGYCGLSCAVCAHARSACPGCREGGGDAACVQRRCCRERGLEGCWECERFPCDKGYFADEAWRGLCIGCVTAIREVGRERFISAAREAFGETTNYGDRRYRTSDDVRDELGSDPERPLGEEREE